MTEYGSREPGNERKIVSASELSEYDFCNVSWYFTRNGYERSPAGVQRLEKGTEMHRQYEINYEKERKRSVSLLIAIVVVFFLMLIIFL